MITYDVNVSYQAEQDLRGIFEYIAFELLAPENAQSQLGRLETAIKPFRKTQAVRQGTVEKQKPESNARRQLLHLLYTG